MGLRPGYGWALDSRPSVLSLGTGGPKVAVAWWPGARGVDVLDRVERKGSRHGAWGNGPELSAPRCSMSPLCPQMRRKRNHWI